MRLWLTFVVVVALADRAAADVPNADDVRAWLADRCQRCHSGDKAKGGVDLIGFRDTASVQKSRKLYRRVVEQVESQEMPPVGEKPLAAEQRTKLVAFLKAALAAADPANPDPGPSVVRRLNRTEYDRTVNDLFGMEVNAAAAAGLPEESVTQSFDNLGESLTLPPILLEKYFAAADAALDKLASKKAAHGALTAGTGRAAVERFARKAFRRPPTAAEIDRLVALYDAVVKRGEPHAAALRWPLKAVLVSPHFLFRLERDRPGETKPYRASGHELAVRLSYFLWATMPDAALSTAADAGALADPAAVDRQVVRMLADPKAKALTDQFAAQWLQLRKLDDARPQIEFFPTFTPKLKEAMAAEVITFLDKLRTTDGRVLDLLDCEYAYVNADLAKHYGIKGVTGGDFRKVALEAWNHRGGLLGMAAVLALTSHTSRTSPTLRGKYVLEVLFGTPPPPPPPDAGTIEDQPKGREPKSFRELLAQHAMRATCSACHKKIDPLGFGLEQFDAIGRWRAGVDATGKLPGGESFDGFDGLKGLLKSRRELFVRNLASQMLTYALGRQLRDADEPAVAAIVEAMAKDGYRYSALVRSVAASYPMLYRKNASD